MSFGTLRARATRTVCSRSQPLVSSDRREYANPPERAVPLARVRRPCWPTRAPWTTRAP
jgi:hypothetical protein